jgi:hypothetical protein
MPHQTISIPRTSLSHHAVLRMQQRSIPAAAVDLLLDYAQPTPVGGGATSYRFTQKSWDLAMSVLGDAAPAFRRYRNAYVIEGRDGVVVTAAWLY